VNWRRRFCLVVSAVPMMIGAAAADGAVLRVCADPNNLPFSDRAGRGFENEIVELIARDLGSTVDYTLCVVPVVNQIRTYWWCSPPRTGRQRMVPASLTARETGASFSKDKCVLISL
jgi:hypothetical protein